MSGSMGNMLTSYNAILSLENQLENGTKPN